MIIAPPIIDSILETLRTILPVSYIVLSLFVTAHVLKFKSRPRASLLWISLVWLAPLLGAFLYYMFGINRISRRAQRLGVRESPSDIKCEECAEHFDEVYWQGFCHLGCKITGIHQLDGNQVQILQGIDTIHDEMIDTINAAQHSVFLTTFIFKHDDIGKRIVAALVNAKSRGVKVYISLDGLGNIIAGSWSYRAMKKQGLNVHRFLHSFWPWRMPYFNLRNHRKILIVDQKIAFTGSVNIGRVANLETHFKISGPVIAHMSDAFLENWAMSTKSPRPSLKEQNFSGHQGEVFARGIKSGPAYPVARTSTLLSGALATASEKVRIVTPYFVPDSAMLSDIELAALRGVKVEIILPNKSNHRITDWASRRQLKTLLAAGCRIYLRDDEFDHSKIMTVDQRWVLIGSSNWDARSLRLNFEFDMECVSAKFASAIDKIIDEKISASHLLERDEYENRSQLLVLRDSAACLLMPYL